MKSFNKYFRNKSNLQMYMLKYFTALYAIMLGFLNGSQLFRILLVLLMNCKELFLWLSLLNSCNIQVLAYDAEYSVIRRVLCKTAVFNMNSSLVDVFSSELSDLWYYLIWIQAGWQFKCSCGEIILGALLNKHTRKTVKNLCRTWSLVSECALPEEIQDSLGEPTGSCVVKSLCVVRWAWPVMINQSWQGVSEVPELALWSGLTT